jgi:hypothetical protein
MELNRIVKWRSIEELLASLPCTCYVKLDSKSVTDKQERGRGSSLDLWYMRNGHSSHDCIVFLLGWIMEAI